jgi:phosphoenolpyruvate-protein kinase (PTS system EI component)
VHELSVAPRSVSTIKQLVRGICVSHAEDAASAALDAATASEAEAILRDRLVASLGEAALLE